MAVELVRLWVAIAALTLYGVLPVLRNTITGLQGVDPTLVEAGRGVGLSGIAVLVRIELPLALPVIMAGIRTALVLVVGTAALATSDRETLCADHQEADQPGAAEAERRR